jgi:hypothetical protein
MRLIVMNIPDQAEALAGWLERQLVGLDLAELVAELQAIHAPADLVTLDDLLGSQRLDVLNRGLSVLPTATIRNLLRHPRLLLDLQELVLEHGGPYWNQVDAGGEMELAMQRGEQRLLASLLEERPTVRVPVVRPAAAVQAWYTRPWVVSLATAAVVLLAVSSYLYWKWPTAPTNPGGQAVAWGWNKPDALPQDLPAPQYLNKLADEAGEWSNKKPDDVKGVAERIKELREGCARVMLAPHKPLKDADRVWLLDRCHAWVQKLDEQLAALDKGEEPVKVRTEVDTIVTNLQKALRKRAETAESA